MNNSKKIAIIGMNATFPNAQTPEDFDRIFSSHTDCVSDISEKRFALNGLNADKKYVQAGYLTDVDYFDYQFFGISRKEASCMDPQQRFALESACRTIESAGYSLDSLRGTNTGVFVGATDSNYQKLFDDESGFSTMSTMTDAIAGRISYLLDLHGEASVMSTACSSSLYSVYDAYMKLMTKSCDMALAGGVNISFDIYERDEDSEISSAMGLISKSERCNAFDDSADGITTCEGVGFVLMKRLDDAIRDNDNILAVITGAGANQDGARSNSITAPSVIAQAELFERVWRQAELNSEDIGYIEAHGTGTKLGDPIEVSSITAAFRKFTDKKQICPIGSLKTNFAHSLYASGIIGIIKAVLSLNLRKKYPLRELKKTNDLIDFENSAVYPISEEEKWNDEKRIFALNSFGLSGTNVHMVFENYNPYSENSVAEDNTSYIVKVSTKSSENLFEYKQKIADSINSCYSLRDISAVLDCGRDNYDYRDSAVVNSAEELVNFLNRDVTHHSEKKYKLVFLCSGDHNYSEKDIAVLSENYPEFAEKFAKFKNKAGSEESLNAVADMAVLKQFSALGLKPDVLIGTKRGNAAIQLANGNVGNDFETLCQKLCGSSFEKEKFVSYMKTLSDSENQNIICVDISSEGILNKSLMEDGAFSNVKLLYAVKDNSLLYCISELYNAGFDVNFGELYRNRKYKKVFLASYPFLKTSAWQENLKKQKSEKAAEKPVPEEADLKDFLRNLWTESLAIESLDDDDDVFDYGLNSLISASVLRKIYKRTDLDLEFDDLYDYCTVNKLYDYIIENSDSEREKQEKVDSENIPVVKRTDKMVLSGNQKRMLYTSLESANKAMYNMAGLYKLEGELNTEIFRGTIEEIVKRHEALHTVYKQENGEYYQYIPDEYTIEFQIIDDSSLTEKDIVRKVKEENQREFDLFSEIPIRFMLFVISDKLHYFATSTQHIACDGWSLGVFFNEISEIYNNRKKNISYKMTPLKIQYADYAAADSEYLSSEKARNELEYWKNNLDGVKGILDFPIDKLRPEVQMYRGKTLSFTIGTELKNKIDKFTKSNSISVFEFLESVYALMLYKYSGDNDICVGVPVANRTSDEIEKLIGFFANTVVVRSIFDDSKTVNEMLCSNSQVIRNALSHSGVLLNDVAAQIKFERKPSHSMLYQYSFVYENFSYDNIHIDGIKIEEIQVESPSAKFDLNFILYNTGNGILINAEYDKDLFSAEYIGRITDNYIYLIENIIDNAEYKTGDISLKSEEINISSDSIDDCLF